jgi:hypothetical protein
MLMQEDVLAEKTINGADGLKHSCLRFLVDPRKEYEMHGNVNVLYSRRREGLGCQSVSGCICIVEWGDDHDV